MLTIQDYSVGLEDHVKSCLTPTSFQMTSSQVWLLPLTISVSLTLGCGGPPPPSKQLVEGKVTVNGDQNLSGMIFFTSDSKDPKAQKVEKTGVAIRGGVYVVGDRGPGLPPGDYKVQILRDGEPQLPLRYSSEDGDLRATIPDGGRKDCDFALTEP